LHGCQPRHHGFRLNDYKSNQEVTTELEITGGIFHDRRQMTPSTKEDITTTVFVLQSRWTSGDLLQNLDFASKCSQTKLCIMRRLTTDPFSVPCACRYR
jgi:hypothetical protein